MKEMAAGHGSNEPGIDARQRMIDVLRAFKQGEMTNIQAGNLLADMQVETSLEEIRAQFDTAWEGVFDANYHWDNAPDDMKDAVDRTLLFLESGCSLPPRPPATARQQAIRVASAAIVTLLLGAWMYVVTNRLSGWHLPGADVVGGLLGFIAFVAGTLLVLHALWRFITHLLKKRKGAASTPHEYWPFESEAHHEACTRADAHTGQYHKEPEHGTQI